MNIQELSDSVPWQLTVEDEPGITDHSRAAGLTHHSNEKNGHEGIAYDDDDEEDDLTLFHDRPDEVDLDRALCNDYSFDDAHDFLQSSSYGKRKTCFGRMIGCFKTYWRPQVLAVLWALFLAEAARGVVLSTLSTYVKSLHGTSLELSLAISLFSVGRLVGAPILGWWYNHRGTLEVLTCALILGIGGSLMYIFAAVSGIYMLLISRVIIGFSTGTLSVGRAHIAAQTTKEERTKFMGYAGAVQFIGFGFMPGATIIFQSVNINIGSMPLNSLTSPGFVIMVLSIFAIGLNFLLFSPLVDSSRAGDRKALIVPSDAGPQRSSVKELTDSDEVHGSWKRMVMIIGAGVYIVLNFVARGVLSLLETLATPIFLQVFKGSNTTDASHFYLILGTVGLSVYLVLGYTRKIMSEVIMLIIGFVLIGVGLITLAVVPETDLTKAQFAAGCTLVLSLGSPIVQTAILSSFSTILGSQPQGTLMGLITMAGSIGRIVFPLIINPLGEQISFIIGAVMSVVSIAGVTSYSLWMWWSSRMPASYHFVVGFPERT